MKFTRDDYNKRIIDKSGKIPADEPVFLLRAQDKYAPSTLRFYAKLLEEDGNIEMAEELKAHARQMIVWQKSVKVKSPDK
ncbi:MAG TPA: hypothetical protein VHO90_13615 [Bacteroidales bacterium]|jgi:hypothetical protein|nr:hypothetical protein [Bacteroidales bacterium]